MILLEHFQMQSNRLVAFFGIGRKPKCLKRIPYWWVEFGLSACPATVTTTIIMFLVVDPYKPSFATVTGGEKKPKVESNIFP